MNENQTHSVNVDDAEIHKFEQLAQRWWDAKGEFRPLHDMNPVRANYIDQRSPVAGVRLLDVGCGGGILSEAMAHRGARVTAIDLGKAPLEVARQHASDGRLSIDYQMISAEQLAQTQANTFDIVTCLEMIEHVPDPASVVSACATLAKPGGHVYFSTLNRNPKAWAMAVLGAEYVLQLLPKGTHDYARFIKPSELAAWSRQCQLETQNVSGIVYNPLTRTFRLSDSDVSVNYLMHLRKPIASGV